MKTRIIWFVVGFLVSWLVCSIIAAVRTRPRDYTTNWPSRDKQALADSISWLKHAKGIKLGQYSVFVPVSKSNASLYVYDTKKHFPGVIIADSHTNGIASDIIVGDAEYKYISLTDKDGDAVFDSYSASIGIRSNATTLYDNNFDGVPDARLGPGREIRININSNWYDLILIDKKQYVQIAGTPKKVAATNGVWRFENE